MRSYVDCIYCYLKQAVNCMNMAGVDERTQYGVLFDLMDRIKETDPRKTPAENSTDILLEVYRIIGNQDPFRDARIRSNELGLSLYRQMKDVLDRSGDRLKAALKISAAGNVIDLGINSSYDLSASLKQCLENGFAVDDYDGFACRLARADEVVVLGDNAGEIVFDRLLVEELAAMGKQVVYVVKGGPILNDAVLEDACQAGIDRTARILTTGSNYLGTPLLRVSAGLKSLLQDSSLVISKGQANFETLEHESIARGRIFFLLKMKCECVARVAGARLGEVVFFTRRCGEV